MSVSAGIVEINVHRMTKKQAYFFVNKAIQEAGPSVYRVRVIHGYHGGTELQRMVRNDFRKNKKVLRIELGLNPGETDLVLREWY